MMRALGAEVVLVPQCEGSAAGQVSGSDLALVFEATERLVAERGAFRADQFGLDGNVRAHYFHTGPELLRQAEGSGLGIDAFVDFVGSGGTWAGVAAALREADASVRCYCVEACGSRRHRRPRRWRRLRRTRSRAPATAWPSSPRSAATPPPELSLMLQHDERHEARERRG